MQLVALLWTAVGWECLSCGTASVSRLFTDTQSCSSGQLTDVLHCMAAACLGQQLGATVCIKFNRSCTACFRGNLLYFGRTFVRLKYLS